MRVLRRFYFIAEFRSCLCAMAAGKEQDGLVNTSALKSAGKRQANILCFKWEVP